ncbi:hypothetical protein LCGC14_1028180 [marine sediment metagenome]|uniref:Uncharacterized protein n=1 Tax=marine sediment metagenome TaxID=412755 RepID=A0A0F9QDI3_9ZZZZ
MGMFDTLEIKYTLPWPEVQDSTEWQSKDTPTQNLDNYELREDGTLWHEAYDERWVATDDPLFGGHYEKTNKRWEQDKDALDGETIDCHHSVDGTWYTVRFWFRHDVVADAVFQRSELDKPD